MEKRNSYKLWLRRQSGDIKDLDSVWRSRTDNMSKDQIIEDLDTYLLTVRDAVERGYCTDKSLCDVGRDIINDLLGFVGRDSDKYVEDGIFFDDYHADKVRGRVVGFEKKLTDLGIDIREDISRNGDKTDYSFHVLRPNNLTIDQETEWDTLNCGFEYDSDFSIDQIEEAISDFEEEIPDIFTFLKRAKNSA